MKVPLILFLNALSFPFIHSSIQHIFTYLLSTMKTLFIEGSEMNMILFLEDVLSAINIQKEQGKQIEAGRSHFLGSLGRCEHISLIQYIKGPRAFSKGCLQSWSFDSHYYYLIAQCRWLCNQKNPQIPLCKKERHRRHLLKKAKQEIATYKLTIRWKTHSCPLV